MDYQSEVCKHCRHWQQFPPEQQVKGQPLQGDCRRQLHCSLIVTPPRIAGGPPQQMKVSYYAQTPINFPACGQFEKQAAAVVAAE